MLKTYKKRTKKWSSWESAGEGVFIVLEIFFSKQMQVKT